ncbi:MULTISPECIES: oxidoreductase [unclassified Saccharibacter]|uniref:oxidoreductase n=1 Tax=unclassified Saccharibacter TaxID=2648722 RepID=UPI0013251080|nr:MULTISPECIES: oxidoreductase [unclassified Saccharibacter]MXV36451.1 SDR family NAD(P)-dependent oxidoreductase [Saccharibacter sp. EH611]MXV57613.1 SDR family NAD(P)-dependent oxidoreductase [Saccharibacter sp. EH70]MXV65080.1 SDR family NAD(P)-dependent oxidoreductase [Saccharibacter sp. EH60]
MSYKVAFVTGASSGIGEVTAKKLLQQGYIVYAAARRVERMEPMSRLGIHILSLDVTDETSRHAAITHIMTQSGRLDVLVNNAGYGAYGALEDISLEEARAQFDVNVFGAMRLIQLALPHMRAQKSGTIINVSSIGGKIYTPLGGWYHGSKFALEGLSDCLRLEVAPFGIHVVIIEPGGIKTEWADIAAAKLLKTSGHGPYAAQAHAMAQTITGTLSRRYQSAPELIANTIVKAVTTDRPKTRYVAGLGAKPLLLFRRLLSDRLFDRLIRLTAKRAQK